MKRRDFLKYGMIAGGAFATSDAAGHLLLQQSDTALPVGIKESSKTGGDLAIVNAKIMTLEPNQPEAEAVLVRGGRIVFVGADRDVRAQAGNSKIFDAGRRLVVPGFIDCHCHFEMACNSLSYQTDCHTPPFTSLRAILEQLHTKAAKTPPGKWVVGRGSFGWPHGLEENRMPTRQDLDAVTEAHPVVVYSGLHVAMFNTLGLKEVGLWGPNAKPPRGAVIHRDSAGVPTGLATEVWTLLPTYSRQEVRDSVRAHAKELFLAKGITSLHTLPYSADDLRADQDLQVAGELPLRLRAYYHFPRVTSLQALLDAGLLPGFGDDMFRFGGIKIFIDGIGEDGLGHPVDDYKWTQDELNDFVLQAHSSGLQLMMHVITHGALEMGMIAVEQAQRRFPLALRHRFEHVEPLESVDDIRRLRSMGSLVTITPIQRRLPAGTARSWKSPPWKTMVREGLEPIAITDSTGTIPLFSPLVAMASVVSTPEEGGGVPPGESLSFEDAIRSWTIWAAKGGFEEQQKGSIAVGKLGDLAVLSADPRGQSGPHLFEVTVDATVVGGQIVYER